MRPARLSFLWAAVLLAAPACFPQAVATDRQTPHSKKTADPFLNGAPFSLDQVLVLLNGDAIPLHRRKEAIQIRGVDFAMSTETIARLKAAGANDDVLELIKSRAKPAPAPPAAAAVKHAPVGGLTVTCAPADCEISLNGTSRGSTTNGTLEVAGLSPGRWVVDFSKNGYVGAQNFATVEADHTASIAAVLAPDRGTQEAFGTELFRKVVQALGGEDGLRALASVQAAGSTTIWTRDGHSVRWTLLMRNNPDRALFQAKSGAILHEVGFAGSEFKASKNLKGEEALELPTDFGFIRDNQLPVLIRRLQNPQYKMLANQTTPVEGDESSLTVENGTEKISIGLDAELRPQRVRVVTGTGVGSLTVTYSDYFKKDSTAYPKTMQIKPDRWQQGLDVHFDAVELNTSFKDTDFKLKGKPLPTPAN
jgi:hypothetical protein